MEIETRALAFVSPDDSYDNVGSRLVAEAQSCLLLKCAERKSRGVSKSYALFLGGDLSSQINTEDSNVSGHMGKD